MNYSKCDTQEQLMDSRDEAIADLIARGYHAQHWDCYTPGAFAVASETVDIGDDILLLRHMVVVVPVEGGWSIRSEFPMGVEGVSLAEAVNAAGTLVSELREFGRPRRYQAELGSPTDLPRE
jgi:hypothetical protein